MIEIGKVTEDSFFAGDLCIYISRLFSVVDAFVATVVSALA